MYLYRTISELLQLICQNLKKPRDPNYTLFQVMYDRTLRYDVSLRATVPSITNHRSVCVTQSKAMNRGPNSIVW